MNRDDSATYLTIFGSWGAMYRQLALPVTYIQLYHYAARPGGQGASKVVADKIEQGIRKAISNPPDTLTYGAHRQLTLYLTKKQPRGEAE